MTNPTLNDILAENEKNQNNPHFLDKLPTTKNRAKGQRADHIGKISRFLPTPQQEAKKADDLGRVFNTTSRAGAGGTRLGVPGIRPSGGKAASAFLEDFTGLGRYKAPPAPFSKTEALPSRRNDNTRKPSVVLYKLCMDCMKPISKDDCVPNMTIVPPPNICSPMLTAKWNSVGIKPGEVICYLFCGSCVRAAVAISKDPAKAIPIIDGGIETTIAKRELKLRGERIADQVFACIKNERENPDSDCFYNEGR